MERRSKAKTEKKKYKMKWEQDKVIIQMEEIINFYLFWLQAWIWTKLNWTVNLNTNRHMIRNTSYI